MNKTEKEALLTVFAALTRPLMRVAFEYGITAGEIAGVVRRTYIHALESRLQEQKRPATDARLGVVSGLSRSEVSELREALRAGKPHSTRPAASLDQLTTLLTVWHTHLGFSGAYGLPMDLDLQPVPGSPRRRFNELVETACPDADPDALLDELVASKSAEIIDGTTVRCLSRAYVPRGAEITRIERMGRFLGVVTANFVHNLLRSEDEPAYFERTVVSDEPLSDGDRDKFLRIAGEKGQELLVDLDTFLTRLITTNRDSGGKRYGVGIYFFEEPSDGFMDSGEVESTKAARNGRHTGAAIEEIDVLAETRHKK